MRKAMMRSGGVKVGSSKKLVGSGMWHDTMVGKNSNGGSVKCLHRIDKIASIKGSLHHEKAVLQDRIIPQHLKHLQNSSSSI